MLRILTNHVRNRKTKPNVNLEDPCTFKFYFHLKSDNVWYLYHDDGPSPGVHTCCRILSRNTEKKTSLMSSEEMELAQLCFNIGVSTSVAVAIVTEGSDLDNFIHPKQISYLKSKTIADLHSIMNQQGQSSADRLINTLKNRCDVNYLLLTHKIDGNEGKYISISGKGRPPNEVNANEGLLLVS